MALRLPLGNFTRLVVHLVILLTLSSLLQCDGGGFSTPSGDPLPGGDPFRGAASPPPSEERSGGDHVLTTRLMTEMQLNSKPRLGLCWSQALAELRAGCERLSEEAQRRVALAFTRCHLAAAGRALPGCPRRPRDPRACTRSMDPVAFGAYTEFYTHAHSVCHHLRAQAWRDDAEAILSLLARGASRFSRQLKRSAQLGESVLAAQGEFARAQRKAARDGESLRRSLGQSQRGVRAAFSELRGSARESRALFAESLRSAGELRALLAGELGGLRAALLYALCCPLAWILTTAASTARARPWLFGLLTAQLLLEFGISTLITWWDPARLHLENEVWLFSWWSRRVSLLVALLLLLFAHRSFRDLPVLNHHLLLSLVTQQQELARHLLTAWQSTPVRKEGAPGTPVAELSILDGAPGVEAMQLSLRGAELGESSLQLWVPTRGPHPLGSPGGAGRAQQVEKRGPYASIFTANTSSSILRCRVRERVSEPTIPCAPRNDAQRKTQSTESPHQALPPRIQDQSPSRVSADSRVHGRSPGRVQDKSPGRVQGRSSGRVQGRSPGRVSANSRVLDQSLSRVSTDSRVQDKSPGRVQGRSPSRVSANSRVLDQSLSRVSADRRVSADSRVQDKSPGRVQRRSPGRVSADSRVQGRSPGRVSADSRVQDKSPGRVQRRSPDRVSADSRVQGRSPGRVSADSRVQGRSPGRVSAESRVQDKSPSKMQDRSPGRVRGRSPGRVRDRASKGKQP